METSTALVSLAFAGSVGMTLVILACALPQFKIWWPLMVVIFYVITPIPTLMSRRYSEQGGNTTCREIAIFVTMGMLVSAFGLPIVLARAGQIIQWGACYLTLCGNVVVFLTLLGFFLTFDQDESDYNMW